MLQSRKSEKTMNKILIIYALIKNMNKILIIYEDF